jgi:hypothetical protein
VRIKKDKGGYGEREGKSRKREKNGGKGKTIEKEAGGPRKRTRMEKEDRRWIGQGRERFEG